MTGLRSHGVTLIELVVVVSILGVVALVTIPSLFSEDAKRLDVATAEIVAALRYTRSEAMRSGEVHGIKINPSSQKVEVYRPDFSLDPVGIELLTHPVDHKSYKFDFDKVVMFAGVSINKDANPFLYSDGRSKDLLFNANGLPVRIDPATATTYPLLDGAIRLDYGALQRTVHIAMNGRVNVK